MIITLVLSTWAIPSPIMKDLNHRENMTSAIHKTEIDLKFLPPNYLLICPYLSTLTAITVDHTTVIFYWNCLKQPSNCSPSFSQLFMLLYGKSTHSLTWLIKPLFAHATAMLNSLSLPQICRIPSNSQTCIPCVIPLKFPFLSGPTPTHPFSRLKCYLSTFNSNFNSPLVPRLGWWFLPCSTLL